MATPPVLDLDRLLKPISENAPTGVELKDDPQANALYFQVKDAREAARAAERQLSQRSILSAEDRDREDRERGPVEAPDWRKVCKLACEILAERSKDLWLAAWLIESLARLHGFAGLRDGFRVTREIVERFWEGIHPRPDEDGYVTTVAQLTGLNGHESEGALLHPIAQIPITPNGLTSADYRDAAAQNALGEFDREVTAASADFFRNLIEDIEQALDEFQQLNVRLDEKCGNGPDGYPAAPPSSAIRNALEECENRVKGLAKELLGIDGAVEQESAGGDLVEVDQGSAGLPSTKKGMSREDAFRALLQVAEYFRRTEPHSPVSYALEQAVRWGRMSLPDLLTELISDSAVREDIFRRAGIQKQEPHEGG
jgi:type VI secretion system protein ImpA